MSNQNTHGDICESKVIFYSSTINIQEKKFVFPSIYKIMWCGHCQKNKCYYKVYCRQTTTRETQK